MGLFYRIPTQAPKVTGGTKALSTTAVQLVAGPTAGSSSTTQASTGVFVSNPLSSGIAVYIGGSDVSNTGAKGVEIQPGDREFFPVLDASLLYAVAASATPTINFLIV